MEMSRIQKVRRLSAAAVMLLSAACGVSEAQKQTPIAEEASPIDTAVDYPHLVSWEPFQAEQEKQIILSESTHEAATSISGTASASTPAARVEVPDSAMPHIAPEEITDRLEAESVRFAGCSGALIQGIGVITAAHCFKELFNRGTSVAQDLPVYDSAGQYVNTMTDLILNRTGDTAFGAFPGHTAREVYEAYAARMPSESELSNTKGTIYTAGFPSTGSGRPFYSFTFPAIGLIEGTVHYTDGDRNMKLFSAIDNTPADIGCELGFSGSQGILLTDKGEVLQLGPFISTGFVKSSTAPGQEPAFQSGDQICSFGIPINPADNEHIG